MTELHQRGDAGPMAVVRARLNQQVDKVVVGQSHVVDATMIAIAVGGHLLLEGPPVLVGSRLGGFSSRPTCCPRT